MKKTKRARGSGSVYKVGRIYWISWYDASGTRHAESSGSTLKGEAQDRLMERTGAVKHHLPVVKYAEKMTVDQGLQLVVNDYKVNGKRAIEDARRRIEKHLLPYFRGQRMANITAGEVQAYLAHRKTQGTISWRGKTKGQRIGEVSAAQLNHEVAILQRAFSLAIEHGKIARKPKFRMLKEAHARQGFFETHELQAVLGELGSTIRPVVEFCGLTGWRCQSEVLTLEWRSVDFDAEEIRLRPEHSKNGAARVIAMTAALRALLEAQWAVHERFKRKGVITARVFVRGSGQPMKSIQRAWRAACVRCGLPHKLIHDLRRTFARTAVRAGVSEAVAMQLTGHKTRSMFQRYNITSAADLKHAAALLDAAAARATDRREKSVR